MNKWSLTLRHVSLNLWSIEATGTGLLGPVLGTVQCTQKRKRIFRTSARKGRKEIVSR
jgi:hypothetical protein